MQVKLDSVRLRQMREARGWSQEHLAAAAGISTRTVQRLETGDAASRETLMALASAFETDMSALVVDIDAKVKEGRQAEAQRSNAQFRLSFMIHLASYAFVIALLVTLNLARRPDELWVLWPAIGWGIGLAAHGLAVFIADQTLKSGESD